MGQRISGSSFARVLFPLALWAGWVLVGCQAENATRVMRASEVPPASTPTPVLQPVSTFTPMLPPGEQVREGLSAAVTATPGTELSPDRACLGPDGLSPDLACDKHQLLAMRDVLRGDNDSVWRNWQAATPIGEFDGIVVAGTPPRVVALEWDIQGAKELTVPRYEELCIEDIDCIEDFALPVPFKHLAPRDFAANQLQGSLPDTLYRLAHLQTLSLHSNLLTGPVPRTLGRLGRLRVLDLSYNELRSGPIPVRPGPTWPTAVAEFP